jgi:hypothetical protein
MSDLETDIIVVPDAHFDPNEGGLDRARLLGSFIEAHASSCRKHGHAPPIVVCLGDWADMASLSSYDKGKGSHEGRRYLADVAAANEALALVSDQLCQETYDSVRRVMVLGNHEARVSRAANDNAEFSGLLSLDHFHFRDHGWEVVPYRATVTVQGIVFSHYFASGVMGRPISGVNPARAMVGKLHESCVAGHNHGLYFYRSVSASGRAINGLVAGCFFEHQHAFAGPQANAHYWRGLVVLRGARAGDYSLDLWSFDRLRKALGG